MERNLYRVNVSKRPEKRSKRQDKYEAGKREKERKERGRYKSPPLKVDQTYFVASTNIADVYGKFAGKGYRGKLVEVREATEEERMFYSKKIGRRVDYGTSIIHSNPRTGELPSNGSAIPWYTQQKPLAMR